ncbi:MAG: ABC transporter permease [Acidobacteriota bacterium]|nr:MAG: ABC transporter permease [Acidobacteriota bacterium]
MKFVRLLLKNLLRNKRRTILTVSSIAVSLFLVATLQTILSELQNPPETPDSALRMIVRHKVSLFNALPQAHLDRMAQIEGVEAVVGSMWFGGVYKDPANFFASFSTDTDGFFTIYSDLELPDEQKEAFKANRTGCIVGGTLADRFDWKLGDRIFLESNAWPVEVELTIEGIYQGGSDDGTTLYLQREYWNELMKEQMGGEWDMVGTFNLRVRSPEDLARVASEIDEMFRNSSFPTKTETEKSFLLNMVSMLGDVQLFITSIVSVVIFTILLVAANTMAMSIRERTREIGILKALGFTRRLVLMLLVGEALFLSLGGALLGSWTARLIYSSINMTQITGGFIQRFYVTPETLLLCAAIGLFVGLFSAGFPAWQASRKSVVDALRRVV